MAVEMFPLPILSFPVFRFAAYADMPDCVQRFRLAFYGMLPAFRKSPLAFPQATNKHCCDFRIPISTSLYRVGIPMTPI